MKKIFLIHFNEDEVKEKIQPLKQAGYKVDYHFSTETIADFRDDLPDVLVICLDRLPSHGRAICRVVVGSKETATYSNYFLWWQT